MEIDESSKISISDKQQRFVNEYLIDMNATQAAIRAGYSERSARHNVARLMANEGVAAALREAMDKKNTELIAKQDEILMALTRTGRRQENDYNVVVLKHKTVEDGLVEEIERAEVVSAPTKNSDAIRALELLGKRYGMWTEKVQVEDITPTFVEDVPDDDE